MSNKIYKIEHRETQREEYSTDLQAARDYLTKKGYRQTHVLDVDKNDADLWVFDATEMFSKAEARILEINCIN